jgi:hypothetical protein
MRKKIFIVLIVAFSILKTNAQESRFVVTAGYLSTTIKASALGSTNSESASGYYIGFHADYSIKNNLKISPEIGFMQAIKNGETSNTLILPVMLKYYPSENFFIQAGPTFDYILDDQEFLKKLGIGLGFGLGLDINHKFFLSTKYSLGLSNRIDGLVFQDTNGLPLNISDIKMKINYLHIGVGYRF